MNSVINKDARIYVAGHRGMVGSALVRWLEARGYRNLVTRTHQELDLLDQSAVTGFMREQRPDYVLLYDLQTSHVLPALLRKAHEAKNRGDKAMPIWGSGKPRREFLHVDDMADACGYLMERGIGDGLYNIGCGSDVTIGELAQTIMDAVGFRADPVFDASKPDGTPQKLLDVSRLAELGWRARIPLREGVGSTYAAYLQTLVAAC